VRLGHSFMTNRTEVRAALSVNAAADSITLQEKLAP
jgi:hypothetical protein